MIPYESKVLGETVMIASPGEAAHLYLVTYWKDEVQLLAGLEPSDMKRIHDVKKIFGGRAIWRGQSEEVRQMPARV